MSGAWKLACAMFRHTRASMKWRRWEKRQKDARDKSRVEGDRPPPGERRFA